MARHISKIHTTSDFEKSFRKIPIRIQDLAIKKDEWFRRCSLNGNYTLCLLKGVKRFLSV